MDYKLHNVNYWLAITRSVTYEERGEPTPPSEAIKSVERTLQCTNYFANFELRDPKAIDSRQSFDGKPDGDVHFRSIATVIPPSETIRSVKRTLHYTNDFPNYELKRTKAYKHKKYQNDNGFPNKVPFLTKIDQGIQYINWSHRTACSCGSLAPDPAHGQGKRTVQIVGGGQRKLNSFAVW